MKRKVKTNNDQSKVIITEKVLPIVVTKPQTHKHIESQIATITEDILNKLEKEILKSFKTETLNRLLIHEKLVKKTQIMS